MGGLIKFIPILILFIIPSAFSQDVGGLNLSSGEGGDAADTAGRSGDAQGEGENGDARNKGGTQSKSRPIISYLPQGVKEFSKAYPKLHFRFVTGDLLSSTFFDYTGMFKETIDDESPLETAVDRTMTVERHAGLATFVTIATAGDRVLSSAERRVNTKLGIEKTNAKVTKLKNLAGLNILAGVYGYFTVDAAINGKSQDEILNMLKSRDTFVLASTMHLAFLGADKVVKAPLEKIINDMRLIKNIQLHPQALEIAKKYTSKTGLGFMHDLLKNTEKLNEIRKDLQKAKITLAATQPETIPIIVGGSIVEMTTYYVFAKVWDKLLQDYVLDSLNKFDQKQLVEDIYNACSYASNQGDLFSDERVIRASEVINSNIQQIVQLKLSEYMDKQLVYAKKLNELDYHAKLYSRFLSLETPSEQTEFLKSLLDKSDKLFDQNMAFVQNLFKLLDDDNLLQAFKANIKAVHDGEKPQIKSVSTLDVSAGIRAMNIQNKAYHNKSLKDKLNFLVSKLKNKSADEILETVNDAIDKMEVKQNEVATKAHDLFGMDLKSIEASRGKYEKALSGRMKQDYSYLPKPKSIYDLILMQKIYTNELASLLEDKTRQNDLFLTQEKNELSLYIQARQWEEILELQNKKSTQ